MLNSSLFIILFISLGSAIISPLVGPLILSTHGFFPHAHDTYKIQAYSPITAGYSLGMIFGHLILGNMADKIGKKKVLLWALLASLIGYSMSIISLLYCSFTLFILSRLIDGFLSGKRSIALAILINSQKNKLFSFKNAEIAKAIGLLLGPLISGYLINFSNKVDLYYYSKPFVFMLIVTTLCIILSLKEFPLLNNNRTSKKKSFFNLKIIINCFLFFIFQLGWHLYFVTITPFVIITWNFNPFQVGVFFSCFVILYIVALTLLLPLLAKQKKQAIYFILFIIAGVSMTFLSIFTERFYLFIICNVLIIIAVAINTTTFMANISDSKFSGEQGKTVGISNSIIGFAWLSSSLIIGYVIPDNLNSAFIIGGLLLICIPLIRGIINLVSATNTSI